MTMRLTIKILFAAMWILAAIFCLPPPAGGPWEWDDE
jgi:hypothetical protein